MADSAILQAWHVINAILRLDAEINLLNCSLENQIRFVNVRLGALNAALAPSNHRVDNDRRALLETISRLHDLIQHLEPINNGKVRRLKLEPEHSRDQQIPKAHNKINPRSSHPSASQLSANTPQGPPEQKELPPSRPEKAEPVSTTPSSADKARAEILDGTKDLEDRNNTMPPPGPRTGGGLDDSMWFVPRRIDRTTKSATGAEANMSSKPRTGGGLDDSMWSVPRPIDRTAQSTTGAEANMSPYPRWTTGFKISTSNVPDHIDHAAKSATDAEASMSFSKTGSVPGLECSVWAPKLPAVSKPIAPRISKAVPIVKPSGPPSIATAVASPLMEKSSVVKSFEPGDTVQVLTGPSPPGACSSVNQLTATSNGSATETVPTLASKNEQFSTLSGNQTPAFKEAQQPAHPSIAAPFKKQGLSKVEDLRSPTKAHQDGTRPSPFGPISSTPRNAKWTPAETSKPRATLSDAEALYAELMGGMKNYKQKQTQARRNLFQDKKVDAFNAQNISNVTETLPVEVLDKDIGAHDTPRISQVMVTPPGKVLTEDVKPPAASASDTIGLIPDTFSQPAAVSESQNAGVTSVIDHPHKGGLNSSAVTENGGSQHEQLIPGLEIYDTASHATSSPERSVPPGLSLLDLDDAVDAFIPITPLKEHPELGIDSGLHHDGSKTTAWKLQSHLVVHAANGVRVDTSIYRAIPAFRPRDQSGSSSILSSEYDDLYDA